MTQGDVAYPGRALAPPSHDSTARFTSKTTKRSDRPGGCHREAGRGVTRPGRGARSRKPIASAFQIVDGG
jgi:hypothetical protein